MNFHCNPNPLFYNIKLKGRSNHFHYILIIYSKTGAAPYLFTLHPKNAKLFLSAL